MKTRSTITLIAMIIAWCSALPSTYRPISLVFHESQWPCQPAGLNPPPPRNALVSSLLTINLRSDDIMVTCSPSWLLVTVSNYSWGWGHTSCVDLCACFQRVKSLLPVLTLKTKTPLSLLICMFILYRCNDKISVSKMKNMQTKLTVVNQMILVAAECLHEEAGR